MATIASNVVMDWQLSSYFGWGLTGIQMMMNWSMQQQSLLPTSIPVRDLAVDITPLEWTLLGPALEGSRELQAQLEPFRGRSVSINFSVLQGLGDDFQAQGGAGVGPVELAFQGIDPTAFHPAPKAGRLAGRFAVFSGGELREVTRYRKTVIQERSLPRGSTVAQDARERRDQALQRC